MPIDVTVMARKMRFVVVHYHIFKNAGSTVEQILEREFAGAFARLHGPTPDATIDGEDLAAFLQDHPSVRAVTSHHLRYPAPEIRNVVLFDCCFVRHPLDRLDSLYSYFQKIDSTDPLSRRARRQTPPRQPAQAGWAAAHLAAAWLFRLSVPVSGQPRVARMAPAKV